MYLRLGTTETSAGTGDIARWIPFSQTDRLSPRPLSAQTNGRKRDEEMDDTL